MMHRVLTALLCVFVILGVPFAYATEVTGNETDSGIPFPSDAFDIMPPATFTPAPVVPDGAVVAESTNEYGMRFYVIQTSDGHTYFLVINGSNVYMLDAVNDDDLNPLKKAAIQDTKPAVTSATVNNATPAPDTGTTPQQQEGSPSQPGSFKIDTSYIAIGAGLLIFLLVAWYIKIIRPKKKKAAKPVAPDPQDEIDDYDSFDPDESNSSADEDESQQKPDEKRSAESMFTDDDEDDFS